jgi:hypothetical protein
LKKLIKKGFIMNRKTLALAILMAVGLIALPAIVHCQGTSTGPGTTPTTPTGGPGAGKHMAGTPFAKAIEHLEKIKEHLQNAPHDFKGHREDAVKAINEAIKQLKLCQEVAEERGENKGSGNATPPAANP